MGADNAQATATSKVPGRPRAKRQPGKPIRPARHSSRSNVTTSQPVDQTGTLVENQPSGLALAR